MRIYGYTYSNGTALCANHAAELTDDDLASLNEDGSEYAVYSTEELHSDLTCDVPECGVILAQNCVPECGSDQGVQV